MHLRHLVASLSMAVECLEESGATIRTLGTVISGALSAIEWNGAAFQAQDGVNLARPEEITIACTACRLVV